jgi:beta-glucosidase
MDTGLQFPKGFTFGCATAAYQIEGAVAEDGRTESIWDRFCHTPGHILGGETGDKACDHYHRYAEDVDLMANIGLNSYRFSISWPRVIPHGRGPINPKGMDYYSRLVDRLLENGIDPYVTLFHWDLPQDLQDKGGWANRDMVYYFRDYAGEMGNRLGDRVKYWMTHNEPAVFTACGHLEGVHAPGIKDLRTALQVAHHLLLSHGYAVYALRSNRTPSTQVGIALSMSPVSPASDRMEDIEAAKRMEGFNLRWFCDPLFLGEYPREMVQGYGFNSPLIEEDDLKVINAPVDFVGINYYFRNIIQFDSTVPIWQAKNVVPQEAEFTDMGWEIYPQGLYGLLNRVQELYHLKSIYITENGAAFPDKLEKDGSVHDKDRIKYLESHFEAVNQAIKNGIPLKGYFIWSLMDNFEWAFGTSKRFGIIYTDYPTQKRYLKDSAYWYQELIKNNQ